MSRSLNRQHYRFLIGGSIAATGIIRRSVSICMILFSISATSDVNAGTTIPTTRTQSRSWPEHGPSLPLVRYDYGAGQLHGAWLVERCRPRLHLGRELGRRGLGLQPASGFSQICSVLPSTSGKRSERSFAASALCVVWRQASTFDSDVAGE